MQKQNNSKFITLLIEARKLNSNLNYHYITELN